MKTSRTLGIALFSFAVMMLTSCDADDLADLGDPSASSGDVELNLATPDAHVLPAEALQAITRAITAHPDAQGAWSLVNLRWEETWALATLASADFARPLADGDESHLDLGELHTLLLVHTDRGWQAALGSDPRVHELVDWIPPLALSSEARRAMFPRPDDITAKAYSGYKFFWPAGSAWVATQGWHDPYTWNNQFPAYTSIDFDKIGPVGTNSDILAGAPGTVSIVCNDGTQALVGITTSGTTEKLGYLHLSSSSVSAAGITQGMTVTMGRKLGQMLATDGTTVSTSCGTSSGTHVHMYFPYKPITIDGVTFTSTNWHSGESLYSSQGSSSPTEVIVDDLGSGFTKFGPTAYWYQASIGYGSHMWWTYVNGTVKSNYAQWKPSLPSAGNYTVYTFIPNNNATSQQAPYRIYHNGANNYATVNQNIYYDAWVSLGTHYFSANGTEYVELSDATGEAGSTLRKIGFDAIKFVKN